MSEKKHHGECLCGAVKFEIIGDFSHFFLCHCSRCQKTSGSAHAANLFSKTAKLEILSGKDKIKDYFVQETRFVTTFCQECGSKLPKDHNGKILQVPAGSIRSGIDIKPMAHIYYESRMQWDNELASIPQYEEGLK